MEQASKPVPYCLQGGALSRGGQCKLNLDRRIPRQRRDADRRPAADPAFAKLGAEESEAKSASLECRMKPASAAMKTVRLGTPATCSFGWSMPRAAVRAFRQARTTASFQSSTGSAARTTPVNRNSPLTRGVMPEVKTKSPNRVAGR